MSRAGSEPAALRLLVVAAAADAGEGVATHLRNAGVMVRLTRAAAVADAVPLVAQNDVVLVDWALGAQAVRALAHAGATASAHGAPPLTSVVAWVPDLSVAVATDVQATGARAGALLPSVAHTAGVVRSEWDIVQALRARRDLGGQLKAAHARCDALIDSARDPLAYFHEGLHLRANAAWLKALDVDTFEDLEGTSLLDLVGGAQTDALKTLLKAHTRREAIAPQIAATITTPAGRTYPATLLLSDAVYDEERCLQVVLAGADADRGASNKTAATEAAGATGRVQGQGARGGVPGLVPDGATAWPRDGGTGLLGRAALVRLCAALEETSAGAAFLFVAPHHHHQLIGQIGPALADGLAVALAARIAQALSADGVAAVDDPEALRTAGAPSALVGRFGDELGVALNGVDPARAVRAAKTIAGAFAGHLVTLNGHSLTVGVAVGGAHLGPGGMEAPLAAAAAHEALAHGWARFQDALARPAGAFLVHDPRAADTAARQRFVQVASAVRGAIDTGSFLVRYQPLVALLGASKDFYEMLVHVTDPTDGAPLTFGRILKSSEEALLWEADRWTVGHAISLLAQHDAKNASKPVTLLASITGASLKDTSLADHIGVLLKEHRVDGSRLLLQLHEEDVATRIQPTKNLVARLTELGVGLGVDHVGDTPHTALLLGHLLGANGVAFLKLGHTLMDEVGSDKVLQTQVRDIAARAQQHKRLVVAEFVENAGALAALYGIGVDYAQGHFIAPPMVAMNHDFVGL